MQHDHGDTTTQQIRLINFDGTGDRLLAYVGGASATPQGLRWLPSGSGIVFVGADGRTRLVYVQSGTSVDWTATTIGRLIAGIDLPSGLGRSAVLDNAGVTRGPGLPTQAYSRIALCDTNRVVPFDAARPMEPVGVRRSARMYSPRYSPDNIHVAYASDQNAAGDKDLYRIRVSYDRAPLFVGLMDQGFAACVPFTMPLQATDADGDPITFQGAYLPPGSGIINGVFRWQVPAVGDYFAVFRAMDPYGGVASQVVELIVWDDGSCNGLSGGAGGGTGAVAALTAGDGPASLAAPGTAALNSMFEGATVGVSAEDEVLLARNRTDSAGVATLAQGKRSWFSLSGALFADVTHPEGTSCDYHAGQAVAYGATQALPNVMLGSQSVSDLMRAGPLDLGSGQELILTTSGSGPGVLLVDAQTGMIGGDGLDAKIRVAAPSASGGTAVEEFQARREVSRRAVRCQLGTTLRLSVTGAVRLVALETASQVEGSTAVRLESPVTATNPSGGDGLSALAGAESNPIALHSGDTWTLRYSPAPPASGFVSDHWLVVRGAPLAAQASATMTSSGQDQGAAPARFGLEATSPNPIHGTAMLSFDLDRRSSINLDLFDAMGRHLRRLASGEFSPGHHRLVWDGTDSSGRPLRPGVYLLRLDARGRRDLRKVAVLP